MEENVEEQGGVGLCLLRELVLTLHNQQSLAQFPHILDHLQRVKVSLASCVHVKDLLGIPDETAEVDRQGHLEGEEGGRRKWGKGRGRKWGEWGGREMKDYKVPHRHC